MPTPMIPPPRMGKILYRPVLVVTWPATIDVTVTPSIIGVSIRPLTVGDSPCTVCWNSGRNVIAPNMARPVRNVITIAREKFRLRKTCSGSIGSAALRLGDAERHRGRHGDQGEADDLRRAPWVLRPAPGGQQDQRGRGHGEQRPAQVVDLVADLLGGHVQGGEQVDQRRAAHRDVDVEDPAPGEGGGDEPAEQRAADGGEHHHHHHVAHVLPALARSHDVAERRHRADHQPAGPQALQRAERDELRHRLRQAGQRRADEEDDDRGDEELLPPVHVAELAVERRGDRGREDVGGHHPGQVRDPAEVAHDPRQRGAHDEVVEHGQQDRQQQPGQHDHHLARREELPARPVHAPGRRPRCLAPCCLAPCWLALGRPTRSCRTRPLRRPLLPPPPASSRPPSSRPPQAAHR